jgi:hypothetical protein
MKSNYREDLDSTPVDDDVVQTMPFKASSFSLDDDAADRFYSDGVYSNDVQHHAIQQFEVDESNVAPGIVSRIYDAAAVAKVSKLFDVTVHDVLCRLRRACFPHLAMFVPPVVPAPEPAVAAAAPLSEDESAGSSDDAFETSVALPAISDEEGSGNVANVTSVESTRPFNLNPDLYGFVWVPVSLVLATAMGSSVYTLLRAVVTRQDVFHGATMSSVDFGALVACASGVSFFVIAGPLCVVALKRYVNDPEESTIPFALCVCGYSLAPLIPGVLLSAVVRGRWVWLVLGLCVLSSCGCALRNLWPKTSYFPAFLRADGEGVDGLEACETPDVATFGTMPTLTRRLTPLWWLRFGVACSYLIAGLLLKLRFF